MRLLALLVLLAAPAASSPAVPAPVELKPFAPVDTAVGKLVRREVPGEEHPLRLFVNGDRLIYQRDGTLELSYLLPQAMSSGDDVVLVAVGSDVPAERSCTHYVFVTLPQEGPGVATAEFGDCSDQFTIQRSATAVTVRFAAHDDAWTFKDGKLSVVAPATKKPAPKSKGKAASHSSK